VSSLDVIERMLEDLERAAGGYSMSVQALNKREALRGRNHRIEEDAIKEVERLKRRHAELESLRSFDKRARDLHGLRREATSIANECKRRKTATACKQEHAATFKQEPFGGPPVW
jgi:predicted ATP-dependent protease